MIHQAQTKNKDRGWGLGDCEIRLPVLPGKAILSWRAGSWVSLQPNVLLNKSYYLCSCRCTSLRKLLHGSAVRKGAGKMSHSQSPSMPTSMCLTLRGSAELGLRGSALLPSDALTRASNHRQSLAWIIPAYSVLFSSTAFTIICSSFKLLCSHSLIHPFNKYLARAYYVPGTS